MGIENNCLQAHDNILTGYPAQDNCPLTEKINNKTHIDYFFRYIDYLNRLRLSAGSCGRARVRVRKFSFNKAVLI